MSNYPENGFYYHYKHDPNGEVNNYAYEVLNVGHHTEIDGLEESAMVVYRPLYETAGVYKIGRHWDLRPLVMFMENVTKPARNASGIGDTGGDGKTMPRFQKIADQKTISELTSIRDNMYN